MKFWTDEERKFVREMWERGKTAGQIARKMELGRQQVEGQIFLMKLYGKKKKKNGSTITR